MQSAINYSGVLSSSDEPILKSSNRSYRYGDGIFESIRVINGKVCFLSFHLTRLFKSLAMLNIQLPTHMDATFLEKEIIKTLEKAEIKNGGRVRLAVFRADGGYYIPETNEGKFLIEVSSLDINEYVLNTEGLKIDLFETYKKSLNALSSMKSSNGLFYVMAGSYAKANGLDDCILLNDMGSLAEGISSNIFIGFNGVLYTPSENQGIIPGIMRGQVIEIAKKNKIEIQECPLNPQVLLKADEVFLTNSTHGIRWVSAYRKKRYFNKLSKSLIEKVNEHIANSAKDLQGS